HGSAFMYSLIARAVGVGPGDLCGRSAPRYRSESSAFSRIADSAGTSPPTQPMNSENPIPVAMIRQSTTIFRITLLPPPMPLDTMLDALTPWHNDPSAHPSAPPTSASTSDSMKNDVSTCQRE